MAQKVNSGVRNTQPPSSQYTATNTLISVIGPDNVVSAHVVLRCRKRHISCRAACAVTGGGRQFFLLMAVLGGVFFTIEIRD